MNQTFLVFLLSSLVFIGSCAKSPSDPIVEQKSNDAPLWAYAYSTPPEPDTERRPFMTMTFVMKGNDAIEPDKLRELEGRSAAYSRRQIKNPTDLIDWFPEDHPDMPDIVRYGPSSLPLEKRWSCGFCHLPNGRGRPENSSLAGLPEEYFIQQLIDMRNGLRESHDRRKPNTMTMIGLAEAMSDEEMAEAAEYFAAIPFTSQIKVIETDTIPKVKLHEGRMYLIDDPNVSEPLGDRIVETPIDTYQTNYLRNPRAGWNAYVPVGSLERGRELVEAANSSGLNCGACHGQDLMGLGITPGIAGRSPSYLMRQMYNFKMRSRAGELSGLMQPVVENLSVDEMTAIVAYLSSEGPKVSGFETEFFEREK